jgi:Beta-lactamase
MAMRNSCVFETPVKPAMVQLDVTVRGTACVVGSDVDPHITLRTACRFEVTCDAVVTVMASVGFSADTVVWMSRDPGSPSRPAKPTNSDSAARLMTRRRDMVSHLLFDKDFSVKQQWARTLQPRNEPPCAVAQRDNAAVAQIKQPRPSNLAQQLGCVLSQFQPRRPGSQGEYSNVGAAWGARLFETTTGVDFNTYTRDNIFTPLKMSNTGWFLTDFGSQQTAIGYSNNAPTYDLGVTPYPMGNLRASARDLGKFMIMWLNGGRGAGLFGARVLAPNTVARALMLLRPGVSQFGFHWARTVRPDGREWWGHGGVMPGNCTRLNIDPITKEGVAILMNRRACSQPRTWRSWRIRCGHDCLSCDPLRQSSGASAEVM